jgi:2-dehydro-3-deoxygluconokinase
MDQQPLDIVCMGEPMVEFTRIEDSEGRPVYLRGFGGDTSNCAIAAARQGARVGYVTMLGADRFGDMILELWRAEGIDASGVARNPDAPTAAYFIEPVPEGRDFTYFRRDSAASRMQPGDVPAAVIRRAGFLQASAISQAISESACDAVFHAIAIAHEAGVRFAYDTNLRLNLWSLERARAVIHETARKADILLPSLDEARSLTGLETPEAIIGFYLDFGPEILALKCGGEGAVIAAAGRIEFIPPVSVTVVDTSGAGDTFDGSLLARLAAGDDPFAAGRYAVAAAALSTTGYGAVGPIPGMVTVEKVISSMEFTQVVN